MRKHPFAKSKRLVLNALRKRGIASVEIIYDGEGDSGQIADIRAHSREGILIAGILMEQIQPADHCGLTLHPTDPERVTLFDVLDAFAWVLLDHYHGGFENDDGGFGTITIDVKRRTVTLDHNDRFSDYHNTLTEA